MSQETKDPFIAVYGRTRIILAKRVSEKINEDYLPYGEPADEHNNGCTDTVQLMVLSEIYNKMKKSEP